MKKLFTLIFITFFFTQLAFAQRTGGSGSSGRGGGEIELMEESTIRMLLSPQSNHLKASLINYLSTVDIERVDDPIIKRIYIDSPGIEALKRDVSESNYEEDSSGGCFDSFNHSVAASTELGVRGAPICFDVSKIARDLIGKSAEEISVTLTALAAHEHLHHFQNGGADAHEAMEREAYALSAYIRLTAKSSSVPLLQWRAADSPISIPVTFQLTIDGELLDQPLPGTRLEFSRERIFPLIQNRPRLITRLESIEARIHNNKLQERIERLPNFRLLNRLMGGSLSMRVKSHITFVEMFTGILSSTFHSYGEKVEVEVLRNGEVISRYSYSGSLVYILHEGNNGGNYTLFRVQEEIRKYLDQNNEEFRTTRERYCAMNPCAR